VGFSVGFIVFFKWALKKTGVFLVGSKYINTEDSHGGFNWFSEPNVKTVLFQRAWFSWFYNAVSRFVFLC